MSDTATVRYDGRFDSLESSSYQARVGDTSLERLPDDLHVPPDAMIVLLESFEGPLDLLLYLIRKNNLNILDFSLADITDQYMRYIDMMSTMRLQLAGEYLVIAATLMMIKSRALLPQLESDDDEEEDASAELRRRLLEYERLKNAAEGLDALPRVDRELHVAQVPIANTEAAIKHPDVDLKELVMAFADVVVRARLHQRHQVSRNTISVRERMSDILDHLSAKEDTVPFEDLFDIEEGKVSLIASLLALLELLRSSLVRVIQNQPFAPIFVSLREAAEVE